MDSKRLKTSLNIYLLITMIFTWSCVIAPSGNEGKKKKKVDEEIKDKIKDKISETSSDKRTPFLVFIGQNQEVLDQDGDGKEMVDFISTHTLAAEETNISYEWTTERRILSKEAQHKSMLTVGVHKITLTVTDQYGNMATATKQVVVKTKPNLPPTAIVGDSFSVLDDDSNGSETVTLNGSGSDPDGDSISFLWTKFNGGDKLATTPNFQITLPVGKHLLSLTVTDEKGATSVPAIIEVTVNPKDNQIPIADLGENITLTDANGDGLELIRIDGSKSSDKDGKIVNYRWTFGGRVLKNGSEAFINISVPVGAHELTLEVTDDKSGKDLKSITIIVNEKLNLPPTAKAAADFSVIDFGNDGSEQVSLVDNGSTDIDGKINKYEWLLNGNIIALGKDTSTVLPLGTSLITLKVTDNQGATGADTLIITVKKSITPPQEPVSLYAAKCAACHNALESTDKPSRTFEDIKNAIQNIAIMRNRTELNSQNLSDTQIRIIVEELRKEVPPKEPIRGSLGANENETPLANRHVLYSKMKALFTSNSNLVDENDRKIVEIIREFVYEIPSAYGGPCTKISLNCPGNGVNSIKVKETGISNSLRNGYRIRACEDILAQDRAVSNLLNHSGLNSTSSFTKNNLQSLFYTMTSHNLPDAVYLNFQNIGTATNRNILDSWRYTAFVICSSSLFEIL